MSDHLTNRGDALIFIGDIWTSPRWTWHHTFSHQDWYSFYVKSTFWMDKLIYNYIIIHIYIYIIYPHFSGSKFTFFRLFRVKFTRESRKTPTNPPSFQATNHPQDQAMLTAQLSAQAGRRHCGFEGWLVWKKEGDTNIQWECIISDISQFCDFEI